MVDSVVWIGASGNRYQFEIYPMNQQFSKIGGIYIACSRLANGTYGAVYVGKTESFHDRLNLGFSSHEGLERAVRYGATYFAVTVVPTDADRTAFELDLIQGLKPPANIQNVPQYGFASLQYGN